MIALAIGSAIAYAVLLWWASTGAILWLDQRPGAYRLSLLAATGAGGAALWGLLASLTNATPLGAVVAFTSAIGLWGWHELSFLTGLITGPRRLDCPADARGWRRFGLAASTLIYHEIALALTAAAIVAVSWGQPNGVGAATFLVLFASRLSAKLNLFLGVPNFSTEFFPDHLRYLASYLRKSPASALFPASMAAGAALIVMAGARMIAPEASAFGVTGSSLILALTALALIEHVFMVAPVRDAALWRWALPASTKSEKAS